MMIHLEFLVFILLLFYLYFRMIDKQKGFQKAVKIFYIELHFHLDDYP